MMIARSHVTWHCASLWIFAPEDPAVRADIIQRAKDWNCQQEPAIEYIPMSEELSAALKRQFDIDREESGPKVPYDRLEYLGVSLESRFSVAHEFETMKAVVDAMPDHVRLRIASIWCDSRACACYTVDVTLGMFHAMLPELVREAFEAGSDGWNGIWVQHGSHSEVFDPYWPGDEEYYGQSAAE